MTLRCALANGAWVASSLPATRAFVAGFDRVAEAQESILLRIVRRNADTSFGREHGFSSIRSIRDYASCVPLRTYEEFVSYVSRIESGEANVLTSSPVDHFEPTSGSSGPSKLIPYTRHLREEFGRAIGPWIGSLAMRTPRAFLGHSYWSLSPIATPRRMTSGGVRIGFERDDEYLGSVRGWLARAVQAVPASAVQQADIEESRRATLQHLLRCRSLSLISVWHPSFLLRLVEPVRDPATAWPHLAAISCWSDAGSSLAASEVARLFPQARIEAKGLLSTEGIVSIPFDGAHMLAYRSHYYELQPLDGGEPMPAAEASSGRQYRVILTTGGGLYRYATGDVVEVTEFRGQCPSLRFVGRADRVSDHFGEKLNEIFVRERLERALAECGVIARFALVTCDRRAASGKYTLLLETDASDAGLARVAIRLEGLLRESFHYDYCRRLGQLEPLDSVRVPDGSAARHLSALAAQSHQRLGDIKPPLLDTAGNGLEFAGAMRNPSIFSTKNAFTPGASSNSRIEWLGIG
ncbi:MAG TPA: GH3 auxin-responsive promoter family protein [Thermoanaerobaculia bacterium]|nr:GH3 auxin-responsive promoter family protein [Thermoanaerobaculia bacterium]